MHPKGFTLFETVSVMMIIAISCLSLQFSTRYIEEMKFNTLIKEVERGIRSAQYMAHTTGKEYNILCSERVIYIRPGYEKVIYKFNMQEHVYIPVNITGKYISFKGSMAPSKAGTIELVHTVLRKKARITIRVATGKTTVYLEKL